MRRAISVAAAAGFGVIAIAGNGIADKKTITDAEGDLNGPPHKDFVSGTQGHEGEKGKALVHTATVAGKADEKEYPVLVINTKGNKSTAPEYGTQVSDTGAVVVNFATGQTKPLGVAIGDAEQVNTYRFAFSRGAIGKPKRKYGWAFEYPEDDRMPNEGYAIHRLD